MTKTSEKNKSEFFSTVNNLVSKCGQTCKSLVGCIGSPRDTSSCSPRARTSQTPRRRLLTRQGLAVSGWPPSLPPILPRSARIGGGRGGEGAGGGGGGKGGGGGGAAAVAAGGSKEQGVGEHGQRGGFAERAKSRME